MISKVDGSDVWLLIGFENACLLSLWQKADGISLFLLKGLHILKWQIGRLRIAAQDGSQKCQCRRAMETMEEATGRIWTKSTGAVSNACSMLTKRTGDMLAIVQGCAMEELLAIGNVQNKPCCAMTDKHVYTELCTVTFCLFSVLKLSNQLRRSYSLQVIAGLWSRNRRQSCSISIYGNYLMPCRNLMTQIAQLWNGGRWLTRQNRFARRRQLELMTVSMISILFSRGTLKFHSSDYRLRWGEYSPGMQQTVGIFNHDEVGEP